MKKRQYYYQVIGANRHIPKMAFIKSESMADAKISFYLTLGDTINYLIRITKKQFTIQQTP
jgi:hypothetical protein